VFGSKSFQTSWRSRVPYAWSVCMVAVPEPWQWGSETLGAWRRQRVIKIYVNDSAPPGQITFTVGARRSARTMSRESSLSLLIFQRMGCLTKAASKGADDPVALTA
jgi:hypothetical protein